MSPEQALGPSAGAHEPTDSNAKAYVRLDERALALARPAWGVVALFSGAMLLVKLTRLYSRLADPSPVAETLLRRLGLSPVARAAYVTAVEGLSALVFLGVAAALARRRSEHPPALLASMAFIAFGASGATLGVLAQIDPRWSLPVAVLGLIYRTTFITFLLVFPDGRFVPPWTRWLAAFWAIIAVLIVLPGSVPLSVVRWPPAVALAVQVAFLFTVVCPQVYRYRRVSDPREREQTRWVVVGIVVAVTVTSLAEAPRYLFPALTEPSTVTMLYDLAFVTIWNLSFALVPLTVGIAILRYRLYDIDVIINRMLVYVALTGLTGGLYAATASLLQRLFVALTGQRSDAAAVLATLVIATAVTPMRNRLQEWVDAHYKEGADPTRRLRELSKQVPLRLSPIEARQGLRRLLDLAVSAYDARGGAAYVGHNDHAEMVYTAGDWNGQGVIEVPLLVDDRRIGLLALCERRDGRSYTAKDRKVLDHVAGVVARAIEEDRKAV